MFGNDDDLKAKLEAVRIENEDLSDRLENEQELRAQAESAVAKMKLLRDASQLDAVALTAAGQIEDAFANGWDGGVTQRKAHIQCLIRALLDDALTGSHGG